MIELKLNKRIVLVEVPEGYWSTHIEPQEYNLIVKDEKVLRKYDRLVSYPEKDGTGTIEHGVELPSGNWSQPIKASEVTEKTAKQIIKGKADDVEGFDEFCQVWYPSFDDGTVVNDAIESFKSLLRNYSLSPDKTILLIEK